MLALPFDTNPTQVAGLLAYAASTLACALAARAAPRRLRSTWAALALVHGVLWLDILLNTRHRLHGLVNQALVAGGWYESRVWAQSLLLVCLLIAVALGWRLRRRLRGLAGAAVVATVALIALVLVEAISWHETDRVLYTVTGPLLVIAWLWMAGAAVVVASAISALRQRL